MEKLIEDCQKIRELSQKCSKYFKSNYDESDPRVGCFNMIYNNATLTLELLSYYDAEWSKKRPMTEKEIERSKEENAQRCMLATKHMFIEVLSDIEFSFGDAIRKLNITELKICVGRRERFIDEYDKALDEISGPIPEALKKFRKTLKTLPPMDSFMTIIERSKKVGFIDKKQLELWQFAQYARNAAVHNNSIANRNLTLNISGREFVMEKDKMMGGKLDVFTYITLQLVESLFKWFCKINER